MTLDYVGHFPFGEVREPQQRAIEFALEAYKSGKRFVVIEAGTGVNLTGDAYTCFD